MAEFWHVKVIADDEQGARGVVDSIEELFEVPLLRTRLVLYTKFDRMWTCEFKVGKPSNSDPFAPARDRLGKLTRAMWTDDSTIRYSDEDSPMRTFEAIADLRKGPMTIPEVFWISLLVQYKVASETCED